MGGVAILLGSAWNQAWFHLVPCCTKCIIYNNFAWFLLGSTWFQLFGVWFLQHMRLVPRPKALILHWRGWNFAWFRPWFHLVPLGSTLQKVYYLQHFGLVPAWFRVVPAAKTRKRGSINYQSRKNDPNPKLPKKLKNLKTIGNLPMVEARIFIM